MAKICTQRKQCQCLKQEFDQVVITIYTIALIGYASIFVSPEERFLNAINLVLPSLRCHEFVMQILSD